jgi:PIN domain nuclease of toxin-antitoxin system
VILLLDAHALIWFLAGDGNLSQAGRSAMQDPANDVLVSAATVWELGIKAALGKIEMDEDLVDAVEEVGFGEVPVTLADARAAAALPPHHRDPFDRMLVAQAQRLDAIVVTGDRAFAAYDVPVLGA